MRDKATGEQTTHKQKIYLRVFLADAKSHALAVNKALMKHTF